MTYEGEGGLADIKSRIFKERGTVTLNTDGTARIVFVNSYDSEPHVQLTPWLLTGDNPLIVNPSEWVVTDGEYEGIDIQGSRLRVLGAGLLRVWEPQGASSARVDWMIY